MGEGDRSDLAVRPAGSDHFMEAVVASLGMEPRLLRLQAAVHEAGHAIVGYTAGLDVAEARVTSPAASGLHGGCTDIPAGSYHGPSIPLPHVLAFWAAGFQATFLWLEGRGIDGNEDPHSLVLNAMAGDDKAYCSSLCRKLGKPDLGMQDGIEGAARILKARWHAVLGLAYALASHGTLSGNALQPYLTAGPHQHLLGVRSYRTWLDRTAPMWLARSTLYP